MVKLWFSVVAFNRERFAIPFVSTESGAQVSPDQSDRDARRVALSPCMAGETSQCWTNPAGANSRGLGISSGVGLLMLQ
jgi:hypothetical protein